MERLNYYNPAIKFDRKALTEVWEILNEYEEGIDEIPEKYLWVIEDNMDKDYVFIIDEFDKSILRKDTKKIITYLYTNFLSTPEERTVLKQLEKIQYKKNREKEESNKIEYPIFNKKTINEKLNVNNEIISENTEKDNLPVKYEQSVFRTICNKIKQFFKNLFIN